MLLLLSQDKMRQKEAQECRAAPTVRASSNPNITEREPYFGEKAQRARRALECLKGARHAQARKLARSRVGSLVGPLAAGLIAASTKHDVERRQLPTASLTHFFT